MTGVCTCLVSDFNLRMSSKTKIPNLRLMLEETREEEKRKSDEPMENELQSKKLKQIRIWVDGW